MMPVKFPRGAQKFHPPSRMFGASVTPGLDAISVSGICWAGSNCRALPSAYMGVCMHARSYACMHMCTYVDVYVDIYVYVYGMYACMQSTYT